MKRSSWMIEESFREYCFKICEKGLGGSHRANVHHSPKPEEAREREMEGSREDSSMGRNTGTRAEATRSSPTGQKAENVFPRATLLPPSTPLLVHPID